jgi:hypothetical protein
MEEALYATLIIIAGMALSIFIVSNILYFVDKIRSYSEKKRNRRKYRRKIHKKSNRK